MVVNAKTHRWFKYREFQWSVQPQMRHTHPKTQIPLQKRGQKDCESQRSGKTISSGYDRTEVLTHELMGTV